MSTEQQLRPGARIAAIHEAGHAVVATHLGVKVERCRLSNYWLPFPTILRHPEYAACDGGETSYASTATLNDQAVITAAGQVATDELASGRLEARSCEQDEKDLREIVSQLGIGDSDLPQWRLNVIAQAREIVSMDSVRAAILRVADDLLAAPPEDGLTGEHVREILRVSKTQSETSE
jgi:hypothetical protein